LIKICEENQYQYQKTVISLQGKTRKKVKIRTSGNWHFPYAVWTQIGMVLKGFVKCVMVI
jgi:hypothetical protein